MTDCNGAIAACLKKVFVFVVIVGFFVFVVITTYAAIWGASRFSPRLRRDCVLQDSLRGCGAIPLVCSALAVERKTKQKTKIQLRDNYMFFPTLSF